MSNDIKWTKQQSDAIKSRGDVIVSASAGTGKTAVLARRCVEILLDTLNPVDIDEILVLTFTQAAADEMRTRISEVLRDEYVKKRDPRIYKQLLQIDAADICTIHSFCKKIITEHFHSIDLDPSFVLLDTDEQALIRSEVLEDVIERAWADTDIRSDLSNLLYRRDVTSLNRGFIGKILDLSYTLCGVVDKREWFERCRREENVDAKEMQLVHILTDINASLEKLQVVQRLDCESLDSFLSESLSILFETLEYLKIALESRDIDKFGLILTSFIELDFKFPKKPRSVDKEDFGRVKKMANEISASIKKFQSLAVINDKYDTLVAPQEVRDRRTLLDLLERFEIAYSQRKQELNCLDFSDLEHYALRLLLGKNGKTLSDVAKILREKYKSIFVDEYQDVNQLQDSIVRAVSSSENLFVVGDVKQSIYSWRQARPEIFLKHLDSASLEDVLGEEKKIILNKNFRSRKEVIDVVNSIFERLMVKEFGGVDYDEESALIGGAGYPAIPSGQFASEFHIVCGSDELLDNSLLLNIEMQGALIASRIKAMVKGENGESEFTITDRESGLPRDVGYGDIVILMRSLGQKASELAKMLRSFDIPVSTAVSGGYFDSIEISDCLSLLRVLDNPRRDIDLVALLRSPFFDFTADELTLIRLNNPNSREDFFESANKYMTEVEDSLKEKLVASFNTLDKWRKDLREKTLAESIWSMLRDSGYLSGVLALPNGDRRRANLIKLHERAMQFEGFVSCGNSVSLGRFIEFIEKLLDGDNDWNEAEPESDIAQGVRIFSIHKSKGLEFPVVFLAGIERKFNNQDSYGDCLSSDLYGPGLQVFKKSEGVKLPSLCHQVIANEKRLQMYHEELRVLYVALTRARERLIMVGHGGDLEKLPQKILSAAMLGCDRVPAWKTLESNSYFDWIINAISSQISLAQIESLAEDKEFVVDGLKIIIHSHSNINEILAGDRTVQDYDKQATEIVDIDTAAPQDFDKLLKELNWEYEYQSDVDKPTKTSVSELTHRSDEYIEQDFSDAFSRKPSYCSGESDTKVSNIEIGTATHLLIQSLDLSQDVSVQSVNRTIDSIVENSLVDAKLAKHIDVDSVVKFFSSSIGSLALSGARVYREWPFTMDVDGLIVQGIIDMLIETDEYIYVVDFKTDRVSGDISEISQKYQKQLELYCDGAKKILKKTIKGGWLYFINATELCQVV